MIGDMVLLQHTAYKGKHKIQDQWENTVYCRATIQKHASFQNQTLGGDDRVEIVHRNLLLPLLSDPLDHAGELDNSRSLVDPKESMGAQVATTASAIASHVHYLGAYEGIQVTNLIQKELNFVTTLFQKY